MLKKRKLLIIVITIIILIGLYILLSVFHVSQKKHNKEIQSRETYLIDDNITGMTGCTDSNLLSKLMKSYPGYKFVKKAYIPYTGGNPYMDGDIYGDDGIPTYHIEIHNPNLDYSKIYELQNMLKSTISKNKIDEIDKKLEGYTINFVGDHPVNVIYRDCSLEREPNSETKYIPSEYGTAIVYGSKEITKGNIDEMRENINLISSLLSGNKNVNKLVDKLNNGGLYLSATSQYSKEYKGGMLIISAGADGAEGNPFNLFYTKNIGNKIYLLESDEFMYVPEELENPELMYNPNGETIYPQKIYGIDKKTIIKDLKCYTNDQCKTEYFQYLKSLLDQKETFPFFQETYSNFIKKINYIFD